MNETKNSGGLIYDEIVDAPGLVAKLRGKSTLLCAYLLDEFSESGREAVGRNGDALADSVKIKSVLGEELSRIIRTGSIYEKTRFSDVLLRAMTVGGR